MYNLSMKGTFCISIDTELLWGRHSLSNYKDFIKPSSKEREVIKKILCLFKKYKIHATWAVVGHLFLEECKIEQNKKHPDIKRPNPSWLKSDWFEKDPTTNLKQNPSWYGTDIIRMIQKTKNQEIASHSFSHIIFGDSGTSRSVAESDIKKCIQLAKKSEITLLSFIFPKNSIAYLDILKRYGFQAFRGPDPYRFKFGSFASRLFMAVELFFLTPPFVSSPKIVGGLVNIPGSMYFVSSRGVRKFIPAGIRFKKARRGIKKAIKENKIFHLWTHPVDLVDNKMLNEFEQILSFAEEERNKGNLSIMTMRQITDDFLKKEIK